MSYVQGFVVPVPAANKQAYVDLAHRAWEMFKEFGALSTVEAWGDDIPDGTATDFKRAVQATPDEVVVLSWIIWPDKATCKAAQEKMMTDDRMKPSDMPFDGRRVIFGGFSPIFEAGL